MARLTLDIDRASETPHKRTRVSEADAIARPVLNARSPEQIEDTLAILWIDPATVVAATEKLDTLLERIAGKLATGLDKAETLARVLGKPVQAATVLGILTDKLVALRKTAPDESTLTLSEFLALANGVKGAASERRKLPPLASESRPDPDRKN